MSRQADLDPTAVRRALVIRPRFLGDLCLTLPVVDHLRRLAPQAEVDYLAEAPYAPVLEGDLRLTRLLVAPRSASPAETLALLGTLRQGSYDLVLDLFCNLRTAVWTAATGARIRVGYAGKGWRSRAYNHLASPTATSAIGFHLESLATLGWPIDEDTLPELHVSAERRVAASARWSREGVPPSRRVVVFHPGAAWPTRRWPVEHFARLARLVLAEAEDLEVRVLAGPGEAELAEALVGEARDDRCRVLASVPLVELPALLQLAAAFVGGDTGPLHVSAGVGTPTLGLFGRSRPEVTFPYRRAEGHRSIYTGIWCSPCTLDVCSHLSCLWTLSPEMALRSLRECLAHERIESTSVLTGAGHARGS